MTDNARYIGIDPGGTTGGIAWIDPDMVGARKMPATEADLWELVLSLQHTADPTMKVRVLLEQVHSMPKQGVASTFKFGVNYGLLQGVLAASGASWEFITPRKWQKVFQLVFPKSLGLSDTEKKNRHKATAQRLFPKKTTGITVTHAVADALLIAEYLRRRERAR
jgi:hypothetical protein